MLPEGAFKHRLWAPGLGAPIATSEAGYDRTSDEVPVEVLATLFVLMLAFGLLLTVLLPFAFVTKALSELNRDAQVLQACGDMAFAVLSLLVLLRWSIIQTMAFIARCRLTRDQPDPPSHSPVPAPPAGRLRAAHLPDHWRDGAA